MQVMSRVEWTPVCKTGVLKAYCEFEPRHLHHRSHDLVAMMSACLAERESSILSGTAILVIDK